MITKYNTKQFKPKKQIKEIKLNAPLKGLRAGDVISVGFVGNVPNSQYWRDRLKDSKIDNCIEVLPASAAKTKKKRNDAN